MVDRDESYNSTNNSIEDKIELNAGWSDASNNTITTNNLDTNEGIPMIYSLEYLKKLQEKSKSEDDGAFDPDKIKEISIWAKDNGLFSEYNIYEGEEGVFNDPAFPKWAYSDSYWFKDMPKDESDFKLTNPEDVEKLRDIVSNPPDSSKPVEEWTIYDIMFDQMDSNYKNARENKWEQGLEVHDAETYKKDVGDDILDKTIYQYIRNMGENIKGVPQKVIDMAGIYFGGIPYLLEPGDEWKTNGQVIVEYLIDDFKRNFTFLPNAVKAIANWGPAAENLNDAEDAYEEKINEQKTLDDIIQNFPEYYYYKNR